MAAAMQIEQQQAHGKVLVCCALGYTRSAMAVIIWLIMSGRATNLDQALAHVSQARRQIVISVSHRLHLDEVVGQILSVEQTNNA